MSEIWLAVLDLDASAIFLLAVTICAFLVPIVIILPPVPLEKSDALLQTHYKAGLEPSKSNLKDQFSQGHKPSDGKSSTVHSLMIYPIKSCKGIEVSKAKVLPQGLEFDRLFAFAQLKSPFPVSVDSKDEKKGHTWELITLRQFARLAMVTVELWLPDEMKLRKQSLRTREAFLILRFPWKEAGWRGLLATLAAKLTKGLKGVPEREILLPVDFPGDVDIKELGYSYENIKFFDNTINSLNMSKEIPEELRLYLGVSNKLGLFRVDPAQLRDVYKSAESKEAAGYPPTVAFQDAFPLHIMNLASHQKFSAEVPKDADMTELDVLRFRPNIILSGISAYDEDGWKQIRLTPGSSGLFNDTVLDISCRTVRCKLPNVDPEKGTRHDVEPDKSLRKLRNVDGGAPHKGCLGVQALPLFDEGLSEEDRQGWVGVGMEVVVQERGEHFYVKK